MVLVFSSNANDSQWVKDEITMALDGYWMGKTEVFFRLATTLTWKLGGDFLA